jgi:hypothetical protein
MSSISPVRNAARATIPLRSRPRRLTEGFAFIAVWAGLGYLLPVGAETYLLLGIPLTVLFQVAVRRRPLRELWVRHPAPGSRLVRRDLAVTALLALAPAYWGLQMIDGGSPAVIGWYVAAVLGAAAAAYALGFTSVRGMLRTAAPATVVGVVGNVLVIGAVHMATSTSIDVGATVGSVLKWLVIYFPATFVIEEVAFRGALDSNVHQPGDGRGWQSALFVSVLWGLWHLPIADGMPLPLLVGSLIGWHCIVGIPLSLAWRRSGNLSGPAFAHSAIDAVRNGLLGL